MKIIISVALIPIIFFLFIRFVEKKSLYYPLKKIEATPRDIGLDYLVVKPYSHFDRSRTTRYQGIRYAEYLGLAEQVRRLATDAFAVVLRAETMRLWDAAERSYKFPCLRPPLPSTTGPSTGFL